MFFVPFLLFDLINYEILNYVKIVGVGVQAARHLVLRCRRPHHCVSFFSCNNQFPPVSGVANGAAQLFELWYWPLVMEANHIYFSVWSPHGLQTLCCTVVRPQLQYGAAVRISVTSCDACKLQFVSLCLYIRVEKILQICNHKIEMQLCTADTQQLMHELHSRWSGASHS